MKDGFIKVGTCSPKIRLADTKYNADRIIEAIHNANAGDVKLVAFPELSITGYTCGDLFLHDTLLDSAINELKRIALQTADCDLVAVIGAPIRIVDKVYNCAVVINHGRILGIVPKQNMPNYGEFYELRHFAVPNEANESIYCNSLECEAYIGKEPIVFSCSEMEDFRFGVELCEDLWVSNPPSTRLAEQGASIIVNLSAGDETIGKEEYRKSIASVQSAKTVSAYIYCSAGEGESTSDMVFSGHSFIYENGILLAENEPFKYDNLLVTEIDLGRLSYDRRRMNTHSFTADDAYTIPFSIFKDNDRKAELPVIELTRRFARNPFVPNDDGELHMRARDILMIQSMGLKKRLEHINAKSAIVGISGGLDSSLALLVCAKTCDLMGIDRHFVHAVTMPCFGTTEHTKNNAVELCEALGVTLHTIPISTAVRQHFQDIGHDEKNHDVTYENSQARMRTLVLMDLANSLNGIVIGTGDLSELALGWATYNGDHMSMYGVNAGVPKTLIKYVVRYYADNCGSDRIKNVLISILNTPISPELLPASEDGSIAQKTEELVGPYELHDFFLYYVLRWAYSPKKIYRIARLAFSSSEFDDQTILKWLKSFYRRFFSQQFKRNCLPDGPKVGSVCLSPRGDWRMPADAVCQIWTDELNEIEI